MKSNKSLFNATLFKSNIKRFLPFSILFGIIELIVHPLSLLLGYTFNSGVYIDFDTVCTTCVASDVFTFIFAGGFSLLVFSYLFSANKCNALHAFPIGRKALFTTNIISAYTLLVVPQLIGFAIAIPEIILFSKTSAIVTNTLLMQFSSILLYSFVVLSFGVLAMLLAGNAFSGAVIYFILNFLYSVSYEILNLSSGMFGIGLNSYDLVDENYSLLSPVINLLSHKVDYDDTLKIYHTDYYKYLAIYFVAAIVICFVSYLLYKLRELECAGEMVAFEIENPFIRVIVSITGAALASIFIGEIFSFGRIGYVVFYIIFSFIAYFATQMILKKKFNIFSGKLIIRWVLCCALSIGVAIGVAVYQTNYIPNTDKIESVDVNTTYAILVEDKGITEQVCELQKELINYEKADDEYLSFIKKGEVIEDYADEVGYDVSYSSIIDITYNLKNGKTVRREYEYKYNSKKINSLITEIEKKNGYTNIFDTIEKLGIDYSPNMITAEYYTEEDYNEININFGDYEKLLGLVKEDVKAMTENYSSVKNGNAGINNETNEDIYINIRISLSKDTDKKALDALTNISYNDFIEGMIDYYDYESMAEINISRLPKNSKTAEYLKNYQQ